MSILSLFAAASILVLMVLFLRLIYRSPDAAVRQTKELPEANGAAGRLSADKRFRSRETLLSPIVLLQTLGGDCLEDVKLLAEDRCLERGLGYAAPKARALRTFLERFHDASQKRPERAEQKSFIFPASQAIEGLWHSAFDNQPSAAVYKR